MIHYYVGVLSLFTLVNAKLPKFMLNSYSINIYYFSLEDNGL